MRVGYGRCDINVNRDFRYIGKNSRNTATYIQAPNYGGISDKTVGVIKIDSVKAMLSKVFMPKGNENRKKELKL